MSVDELYISYFFPPDGQVSGINVLKRIIENEKKVDILHANSDTPNFSNDFINQHIIVDISCNYDWANCIFEFIEKGLKAIDNDYKKIYSRSWLMSNHFLACAYKFKNSECYWSAEFSDPLIFDLSNKKKSYKEMIIDNPEYINEINDKITQYNKLNQTNFALIKNKTSAYFICEYITYLFADEIIFTNPNQRQVMLNQFPVDIKEHILNKTKIKIHSSLPLKYYYLKEVDLNLNEDNINIAYFGNEYYGKRHFESLFYAVESLNHKYKNKLRFYFFISNDALLKSLINTLESKDLFIVKKPLEFFEFLNATTQFDILMVNDVITKNNFDVNPYLPSKLSDYLTSNKDIWALYEKGSMLSQFDLKYKSDILNFNDSCHKLVKILKDYDFHDENYTIDDDYIFKRLTSLNELYEREFNRNITLKRKYNEITSSNSWKITKPLRKLRK